ncbi:MAG: type II secretion system F family protein [Limisphaerales bacterium]
MKLADLAFVNQQLAGIIRNGRPLEGALRQLCRDMSAGRLKTELTALEQDLAGGTPLGKAIEKRNLPAFYRRMLQVGEASNDVPGMMLLLANYYNRIGIL